MLLYTSSELGRKAYCWIVGLSDCKVSEILKRRFKGAKAAR